MGRGSFLFSGFVECWMCFELCHTVGVWFRFASCVIRLSRLCRAADFLLVVLILASVWPFRSLVPSFSFLFCFPLISCSFMWCVVNALIKGEIENQ